MSHTRAYEHTAHIAVSRACEGEHAPAGDEIGGVGVVFDVTDSHRGHGSFRIGLR
jgi:hypothetical protein